MGLQSRRYEGMKPWVGFMKWDIPDPACGEGKYTHSNTLSLQKMPQFLHDAVSLTPTPKS